MMCWPLSRMVVLPSGRRTGNARARPPSWRDASNTVTRWPAPVAATAAAMPAHPAPTMATFIGSHPPERLDFPGQPELAQRRQADALMQHLEIVVLDLTQQ